jgi:peptidoglycan-associated lipoprotein
MTARTRWISLLAVAFLVVATGAGCRTQVPADEGLAGTAPDATDSRRNTPAVDTEPEQITDPFGEDTLREESLSEEDLSPAGDPTWVDSQLETLYFDFDRSSISDSSRVALDNNADFLLAHPDVNVRVEGHCDERGTTEYNLSLGDRRASSAREYLILRGVAAERLLVVSFGEERPADPGQSDASWARNRRVEFHAR